MEFNVGDMVMYIASRHLSNAVYEGSVGIVIQLFDDESVRVRWISALSGKGEATYLPFKANLVKIELPPSE